MATCLNRTTSAWLSSFRRGGKSPEGTTIWYLRVIHQIAQGEDVHTLDISGEEWGEVDFPEDVEAARELTKGWDARG